MCLEIKSSILSHTSISSLYCSFHVLISILRPKCILPTIIFIGLLTYIYAIISSSGKVLLYSKILLPSLILLYHSGLKLNNIVRICSPISNKSDILIHYQFQLNYNILTCPKIYTYSNFLCQNLVLQSMKNVYKNPR